MAKTELARVGADAWIIVDYENRNPTLVSLLGRKMLTRKIFVVIPTKGKPYIICHAIDKVFLQDEEVLSQFDLHIYRDWREMLAYEKKDFSAYECVMADISEDGLLPRVSLADFGSIDFLRRLGLRIISSADILQHFSAVYDERAYMLQRKADELVLQIKDEAFAKIKGLIQRNRVTDELTIQRFIADRFIEEGMTYDDPPIVAIGQNAIDPHYGPSENRYSPIKPGDLVLIDMWAKMNDPDAVYGDITWMGFVGSDVPEIYSKRFSILHEAIDACLAFLSDQLPQRKVLGFEVDDVARSLIEKYGYGRYFTHRTGHNIAVDAGPHGPGVNIDDYESHDGREIIDGISFSLEPGIYAPDFGMRSETNVYVEKRKPIVVAGRQEAIIPILK